LSWLRPSVRQIPSRCWILRSRRWLALLISRQVDSIADIGRREGVARAWISNQLPLAFLALDIVRAILTGGHPAALTLDHLIEIAGSPSWVDQRMAIASI
jgi:hypothetical protein